MWCRYSNVFFFSPFFYWTIPEKTKTFNHVLWASEIQVLLDNPTNPSKITYLYYAKLNSINKRINIYKIRNRTNKLLKRKQKFKCTVPDQCNEKSLIKLSTVFTKTLKCLPKILFNMDIMYLHLLPCFCIVFQSWLGSVTKVLLSEAGLSNF